MTTLCFSTWVTALYCRLGTHLTFTIALLPYAQTLGIMWLHAGISMWIHLTEVTQFKCKRLYSRPHDFMFVIGQIFHKRM